ncbi:hypothetical protein Hdeb2414_s0007g00262761 [Helianthus debilis subsp. tardiflorus]
MQNDARSCEEEEEEEQMMVLEKDLRRWVLLLCLTSHKNVFFFVNEQGFGSRENKEKVYTFLLLNSTLS